jgi:hypothetical protein
LPTSMTNVVPTPYPTFKKPTEKPTPYPTGKPTPGTFASYSRCTHPLSFFVYLSIQTPI